MTIMLVMQMAIHEIVDMVPVRNRLVPATWSMNVGCIMSGTNMPTRAGRRIRVGYVQCVFLDDSVLRLMMQMTIVQKVNVVPVLHGGMAAIGTMDMGVVFVCMTHFLSSSGSNRNQGSQFRFSVQALVRLFAMRKSVRDQVSDMIVRQTIKNMLALTTSYHDTLRTKQLQSLGNRR